GLGAAIGGAVIDDDDLERRQALRKDRADRAADVVPFVVQGNDDGEVHEAVLRVGSRGSTATLCRRCSAAVPARVATSNRWVKMSGPYPTSSSGTSLTDSRARVRNMASDRPRVARAKRTAITI